MSSISVTINETAAQTITRMREQTTLVERVWGRQRPDVVLKMALSLSKALEGHLTGGWGPTTIYWDSDLSLCTSAESGFTFGTIFHATERPDVPLSDDLRVTGSEAPREGRYCMARRDGTTDYCGMPVVRTAPTCEGHDPIIAAMPVPGEWSFHS
jgi:hypothetical protein